MQLSCSVRVDLNVQFLSVLTQQVSDKQNKTQALKHPLSFASNLAIQPSIVYVGELEQILNHSRSRFTSTVNLKSPVHPHLSLDCGRKLEYQEKTQV